jgi:hypothetical protein
MSRSPPVGQALGEGAPGLPDPSDADEDEIARAVEALYLGSGSAQDAWTSISERCRRIEWGRSYEAFASAFAGITRDRVADPIDFHVVGVDLRVFTDDYAEVHLEIERDGTRIELPSPRQYRLEEGHWRDDDCSEPSENDGESRESQTFEAVGEEISADGS